MFSKQMSMCTGRRVWLSLTGRRRVLLLDLLPTEILLLIIEHCSASAKGCLALTCRRFSHLLPADALRELRMPREQKLEVWSWDSPPECQLERYNFLRLLEEDLRYKYLFCWDCFILHPRHNLSPASRRSEAAMTLFRRCTKIPVYIWMSCSRDATLKQPRPPNTFTGVVDLCPCIKLTPSKSRKIAGKLRALKSDKAWKDRLGLDGLHWHTCRHRYGEIDLGITIWFDPMVDGKGLQVRTDYTRIGPKRGDPLEIPRKYCPHHGLDDMISTLGDCHDRHKNHTDCPFYRHYQNCKVCETTLVHTYKKYNHSRPRRASKVRYDIRVERTLRDETWYKQAYYLPDLPPTFREWREQRRYMRSINHRTW